MKPAWAAFWLEYPDYGTWPDSSVIKQWIGGEVNGAMVTNTCAVRLSCGLNYSGVKVPAGAGMLTLKGSDKLNYALRVREMRRWLPTVLGQPYFDKKKKAGEAFDKTTLSAFKGIIGFDIHFADATGHLDAWDGKKFSSEYKVDDYWTKATRITLWKLM
jgi:hypothetical protein